MLEKATVLTTLLIIVDGTMKGSSVIQHAFQRLGPAPQLSESEQVIHALSQERIGESRKNHCFRLRQASALPFFPGLNERSRFHRRKRYLWSVILAVRVSVQFVLDALVLKETAVIDSAPASSLGGLEWQSPEVLGCTFHSVVSLTGVIMNNFLLPPASPYDNQPVSERLDSFSPHLTRLLGDEASNDADLQRFLEQSRDLHLLAPVKVNQSCQRSKSAQQQLNRFRLIWETVNGQLQEQVHMSKHSAKRTHDQDRCRGHGSSCRHDGQCLFGMACSHIS